MKMVHFVPLPKLPSTRETAEVMLLYVFCLRGFPKDVMSDRGHSLPHDLRKPSTLSWALQSASPPDTIPSPEARLSPDRTMFPCLPESSNMEQPALFCLQCTYGYQPPLFPALEEEVGVPSVQALIHQCCRIWNRARQVLLQSSARTKRAADCRLITARSYRPGQKVWLS